MTTTHTSTLRITRAMVLAAMASTGVAAALGAAPTASATCASFWGLGNSANCTSTLGSVAIAMGTDAFAHADGLFGAAFALGDESLASVLSSSFLNLAAATGPQSRAEAGGLIGVALALGDYGEAAAGGGGLSGLPEIVNVAVNIGNHTQFNGNQVNTAGVGAIAMNLGGDKAVVEAVGYLNTAVNLLGNNTVKSGRTGGGGSRLPNTLGTALSAFGNNNTVTAGPGGVFNLAASIAQTNATVAQPGTGFNIDGLAVPPVANAQATAAAASKKSTATVSAHTSVSAKKTVKRNAGKD